jgi:hypothetical protein
MAIELGHIKKYQLLREKYPDQPIRHKSQFMSDSFCDPLEDKILAVYHSE